LREYLPRTDSPARIQHIMDRLAAFEGSGGTQLGTALESVHRQAGRRGIVIVISDLMDDEEGFARGLERLVFSGHEVIVFHTLDPYELTFPFQGMWEFNNLEGADKLKISPEDYRKAYLRNI